MFKRILLPVDTKTDHEKAFAMAANLVDRTMGRVMLLHIIDADPRLVEISAESDFFKTLQQESQQLLAEWRRFFDEKNIPCDVYIRFGQCAHEIAEFAEDIKADLLIMSAPAFDPRKPPGNRKIWDVTTHCQCPVLVV